MYCSSCSASVAQGLSYCNFCGAKLSGVKDDHGVESSKVKPELLVSAMVGLFVLGLVAIAVLIGVLKSVAGFDLPFLLVASTFSFLLMLVVEGVLIRLLLKGNSGARKAGDTGRLKAQTTNGLAEAQVRVFPEPVPSVTEHTTRSFDPANGERK